MNRIKDWPTILYFGNDWSADNRTSSHHIAHRLVRDHMVIYIECPGLRAPKGNRRDVGKLFSKLGKVLQGPQPIDRRSYVFTLFQVPFHRFGLVRALNRKLVVWSLRWLCQKLTIQKPLLWFVLPHLAMVLNKLDESLKVYYCIDQYASLPGVNKPMIEEMDRQMTQACDVVFCSAKPLLESKKKFGPKVKLSRHGVDFDHFNSVYTQAAEVAEEVKDLRHPVIGFFGLVEKWVDLDLIRYAALQRPQWSFLIIGRVAVAENPCQGLPNVHFIGPRSYEVLPNFSQVMDVTTIPCVENELIYNFNPLKLREYLAMGKPVVSTWYPEVEAFEDVVYIGRTKEAFLANLEKALASDSPARQKTRVERVRGLSWEAKYQKIIGIVDGYYRKKKGRTDDEK